MNDWCILKWQVLLCMIPKRLMFGQEEAPNERGFFLRLGMFPVFHRNPHGERDTLDRSFIDGEESVFGLEAEDLLLVDDRPLAKDADALCQELRADEVEFIETVLRCESGDAFSRHLFAAGEHRFFERFVEREGLNARARGRNAKCEENE